MLRPPARDNQATQRPSEENERVAANQHVKVKCQLLTQDLRRFYYTLYNDVSANLRTSIATLYDA